MANLLRTRNQMCRQADHRPESWEESSGTAMLAFAMIKGLRHGWRPEERMGWPRGGIRSLTTFVDQNADVTNIFMAMGKQYLASNLARPGRWAIFTGQSPLAWATWALLEWR
jgi:hypothetical protein